MLVGTLHYRYGILRISPTSAHQKKATAYGLSFEILSEVCTVALSTLEDNFPHETIHGPTSRKRAMNMLVTIL